MMLDPMLITQLAQNGLDKINEGALETERTIKYIIEVAIAGAVLIALIRAKFAFKHIVTTALICGVVFWLVNSSGVTVLGNLINSVVRTFT